MNLPSLIHQPLLPYFAFKAPWFRCFHSFARSAVTYCELFTILETVDPMEDSLDNIRPCLSPDIVTSVIQDQPNRLLGFRFFIWAIKRKRLHNWVSHSVVIEMLTKDSGFDLYWETLQQLRECKISIPSLAFLVLIKGYVKLGMVEKAIKSFSQLKDFNCEPSVIIYNTIMYVMVQKQVLLLALAVYNQMLKLSCSPDTATFNILIDGLCKNRKINEALQMYDEMVRRSITPNEITYTIFISGLCKAERTDEAHRLFMKAAKDCTLSSIIHNALLYGYCKLGRLDEAFALLCSFLKAGYVIGLKGYSCLIDGLFRARRYDEAHGLFRRMMEEGIELDSVFYTIMIRGLLEEGRSEDAMKLLVGMTEKGLYPDTYCYNSVIKAFCDIGNLDEARSHSLEILKQGGFPDVCTYTILICGMCRNGLVGEAQQIFNEMEERRCLPSVVTFNALIDGLCKSGQLEEAEKLFLKMGLERKPSLILRLSQGRNRIDNESLQKQVIQLCESGLFLEAYKILTQLAKSGVVPDITTCNILMNGFCKAGNLQGAMKYYNYMLDNGLSPNSVTYGTLMDGFQRIGQEENASRVFDQMLENRCEPSSAIYKSFMTWSCRKGDVSSALRCWLEYQGNLFGREKEAIKAFEEHFRKGEIEKVIRGLLEMDFRLKEFDLAPYMILLIGLCQARRVDEALTIFSILKECKVNLTLPSCVKLIHGLCGKGSLDSAIEVFCYTLEKGFKLKPQICNLLLKCLLCSHDKRNHAYELMEKMESSGYDLNVYLFQTTRILLKKRLMTYL